MAYFQVFQYSAAFQHHSMTDCWKENELLLDPVLHSTSLRPCLRKLIRSLFALRCCLKFKSLTIDLQSSSNFPDNDPRRLYSNFPGSAKYLHSHLYDPVQVNFCYFTYMG